ncbi:hypothetical protein PR001_g11809 [Phytophthora rubi]|uniref:Uncharacterized protein n=1 Tax=Phytophthora rubi TaxID=129364 RepID=A0A6A3M7Y4_9STRA|nr:hypothetical protein PR001_g11809 [Phytophthora rubi]
MLQAHVAAQKPQKKMGNPPIFHGQASDDLELWLFSTEQYYASYAEEIQSETSEFVNTIFANLGPTAQTWYRDFKLSLGDQPATWTILKQRIREHFRDSDFQHKVLSKLHNLRWSGSQQAYTTKVLHLLSQLDCELPEVVKRWFYQQNLRPETSAFVSQNVPSTLQEVMELAQRFKDARASTPGSNTKKEQGEQKPPGKNAALKKNSDAQNKLPCVAPQRSADVEAGVELSNDTPVARKQFRLSDEMKESIRAWTLEMLEAGIIRPSKSPYCAPTFCVKKAVGWRIVHDFRGINSKLRIPATPVPRKEDIFDAIAGGHYFSAMDLLWGLFQVRLREKDIQHTAFSTRDSQFEYLITPMGLACSPSAFNRMMQQVFSDQRSFCRAYFDDLFVFTKTASMEDHSEALDKVLKRCEEQQLYIKLEKCTFCASEIPCLGDFFGRDGIRMDPDKCRAIREWPLPRTRRQL